MASTIIVSTDPGPRFYTRPENIVLEWVVGYSLEPGTIPRWARMQREDHRTQEDSNEQPIQIASIYLSRIQRENGVVKSFQIGISILDTQSLGSDLVYIPNRRANRAARVIQSHHWVIGDSRYKDTAFRFGTGKFVALEELERDLKGIVKDGNFVLITHARREDLLVLEELNISIKPLFTIDTAKVSQDILRLSRQPLLYSVMLQLGCKNRPPRIAGNDAHMTIRLLLMLISQDSTTQLFHNHPEVRSWMTKLHDVGTSSIIKRRVKKNVERNDEREPQGEETTGYPTH